MLPADTGDTNIDMVEDRHTASTELNAQGGIEVSRNNAVTGAKPAGGTYIEFFCICFYKPVNAGLNHGHRYSFLDSLDHRYSFVLSCPLFDLQVLLCCSLCAVLWTR